MISILGCRRENSVVVLYTSQDREYAEPILQDFTRQTGIKVNALYDTEAAKTVGLASRLLAEKSHPQCDVFWNNEELRTWQLAAKRVLETNWATFGYRERLLVITEKRTRDTMVSVGDVRFDLERLTNRAMAGKVALAYPLFGTTATHLLALRQHWGATGWENWCRVLQANKPFLVDGNSAVVKLVARGEAFVGVTDSDDVAAGNREGLAVTGLALTPPMLMPNTIALATGRPHPAAAQKLFEFLERPEIAKRLVEAHALESTENPNTVTNRLQVNYPELLRDLDAATHSLEQIFLR